MNRYLIMFDVFNIITPLKIVKNEYLLIQDSQFVLKPSINDTRENGIVEELNQKFH